MSIPVEVADLPHRLAEFDRGYLLTSRDGLVKAVSVRAVPEDGTLLVPTPGRGSVANVGANLLAGVLFVGALVLAAVVVALLASLLAVLGGLLHPKLGALLMILTLLGFAAVVLVTVVGAAYLAWRDTFGDGAAPPPPPEVHGFEA